MNSVHSRRRSSVGGLLLGLVISLSSATIAKEHDRGTVRADVAVPAHIAAGKLDAPIHAEFAGGTDLFFKMAPSLRDSVGRNQVIVRLKSPAAAKNGPGTRMSRRVNIQSEQAALIDRLRAKAPDIKVIAQTQLVLNAVFVEVDAAYLPALAGDTEVARIAPVGNYELDLSDTVPYIGAAAVQAAGNDGSGVSVAVLDSGIDYTHADLGGSGDPADYAANDGTIIEEGTFPTAKVVGGYDFLGNEWPFGPRTPDPDPLDDLALVPGAFAGHGTHVADIIAGNGGVAPGADLYAVKVCASLASSCNGIALVQGMEFAVDPNGDGDTSDHVDIVNMSLGATYGQAFDDDLSAAVDNATAIGVFTVSSAGNCGDRPWCTGSPSSAPTALSVAQTQVPSAKVFKMEVIEPASDAGLYDAVKYTWTPDPAARIEEAVQYGDNDGSNLNGCAAFTGDLSGKIVAVDRGACTFSSKIRNIENAGGIVGIVMLIDGSAPFPGGFGGGSPINIPGFNISNADGAILRARNAVVAFGPELSESRAGSTVASTARGPELSFVNLKPEIGAPGASLSAEVGTGTERTPFGGTSGASPMVAGSAALLQQACRADGNEGCSPLELKSQLMNTAFRDVISDTTGGLAEVTRIGGGEVRVDVAIDAPFRAYSRDDNNPSISLGVIDGARDMTIKRDVRIDNLSGNRQRITVSNEDRNAAFAADGAIEIDTRSQVNLGKEGKDTLNVKFNVDASELNSNAMNSGSAIADPVLLGFNEIAGYLVMNSADGEISVPWHAIARQAADVDPTRQTIVPDGFPDIIGLENKGIGTAQNDAYTIIGLSDEAPRGAKGAQAPAPDLRAVGVTTIPVPAGFCSGRPSFLWIFAFNTWDRQTSLLPVIFQVDLDTNQDGLVDYQVFNAPLSIVQAGNFSDPRELTWAFGPSGGNAFFFAEHATNSANTSLTICAEQVGLTGADILATNVDVTAYAFDFYFGGPGDQIEGLTITPLGEGYYGVTEDTLGGETGRLEVFDFGAWPGNTPEAGVMMFTNGNRGGISRGAATEDTEALLFLAPGVSQPQSLLPNGMIKKDKGR